MENGCYVLRLDELSRADARRTGFKAAHLGELLRAGFAVPAGFVLTVEAFERFCAFNAFDQSTTATEVAEAPLPDDVGEALLAAHATIPDVALAVRSSGVAEDLPGASFAGQYETLLGVRGQADLVRAVSHCWSSAFSERVAAYRSGGLNGAVAPLAVLVQLLVAPDAAGVAFTVNPVTGGRDEVVVSAVRGLGERLASGVAQPDEWVVRDGRALPRHSPEDAIRPSHALLIADAARRIEAFFEEPQDIEWALAADELFVLQARPVTALPPPVEPVPLAVQVPPGYWEREATHFPRPLTPMAADLMLELQNPAFSEMFAAYGLLLERIEMREIGGWVYARAVPLGGKDRRAPPPPLMWLLARTVPQLRNRIGACRQAIRSDRHGRDIDRWCDEWQPDLAARIGALSGVELDGLSDAGLQRHLDALTHLLRDCVRIHFLLHGAMLMVLAEFGFACRDLLGWDDLRMLELLNGLSEKSSAPSRRLAELAQAAARSPSVRSVLERLDDGSVERACAADAAFAARFADYLREYGCRALSYEFVEPTLAERPELILQLIRDQVERGYDPSADAEVHTARRRAAAGEARRLLAGREADTARFDRALARAERAYPVREDSEFYTVSAPLGVMRYAALEVGHRLAARGRIDGPRDVFLLTLDEARAALASGRSQREPVAQRRAERAWTVAHPGPASYGRHPGVPPSSRVLPREARFAMEALQWAMLERILAPQASQQVQVVDDRLCGIAASAGTHTGSVRVVMDETDFGKVQAGDVLVCLITSPVWSVLFPSIGALVTDTGGTLSHAAIIAREYRLPAVVGTGNATSLLKDGQLVTVDGSAGLITLSSAEDCAVGGV
jgi:rifampicin phosphotransferase